MDQQEVEEILGKPDNALRVDNKIEWIYYLKDLRYASLLIFPIPIGREQARLVFNEDDKIQSIILYNTNWME